MVGFCEWFGVIDVNVIDDELFVVVDEVFLEQVDEIFVVFVVFVVLFEGIIVVDVMVWEEIQVNVCFGVEVCVEQDCIC